MSASATIVADAGAFSSSAAMADGSGDAAGAFASVLSALGVEQYGSRVLQYLLSHVPKIPDIATLQTTAMDFVMVDLPLFFTTDVPRYFYDSAAHVYGSVVAFLLQLYETVRAVLKLLVWTFHTGAWFFEMLVRLTAKGISLWMQHVGVIPLLVLVGCLLVGLVASTLLTRRRYKEFKVHLGEVIRKVLKTEDETAFAARVKTIQAQTCFDGALPLLAAGSEDGGNSSSAVLNNTKSRGSPAVVGSGDQDIVTLRKRREQAAQSSSDVEPRSSEESSTGSTTVGAGATKPPPTTIEIRSRSAKIVLYVPNWRGHAGDAGRGFCQKLGNAIAAERCTSVRLRYHGFAGSETALHCATASDFIEDVVVAIRREISGLGSDLLSKEDVESQKSNEVASSTQQLSLNVDLVLVGWGLGASICSIVVKYLEQMFNQGNHDKSGSPTYSKDFLFSASTRYKTYSPSSTSTTTTSSTSETKLSRRELACHLASTSCILLQPSVEYRALLTDRITPHIREKLLPQSGLFASGFGDSGKQITDFGTLCSRTQELRLLLQMVHTHSLRDRLYYFAPLVAFFVPWWPADVGYYNSQYDKDAEGGEAAGTSSGKKADEKKKNMSFSKTSKRLKRRQEIDLVEKAVELCLRCLAVSQCWYSSARSDASKDGTLQNEKNRNDHTFAPAASTSHDSTKASQPEGGSKTEGSSATSSKKAPKISVDHKPLLLPSSARRSSLFSLASFPLRWSLRAVLGSVLSPLADDDFLTHISWFETQEWIPRHHMCALVAPWLLVRLARELDREREEKAGTSTTIDKQGAGEDSDGKKAEQETMSVRTLVLHCASSGPPSLSSEDRACVPLRTAEKTVSISKLNERLLLGFDTDAILRECADFLT
ncbi:unnamed protein product [Amoebophrya sp. A25]|nr:unnamed protein product [Amoebophrya sp. A25]|eukprot:GSA25T00021516001.1